MRNRWIGMGVALLGATFGLLLVACGGGEGDNCRSGVMRACVCADDSVGTQTCASGEFGACVCESADAGGGGEDAGGGGTDGGGGGTDGGGGDTDGGMSTMSMYAGMVPAATSVWGTHVLAGGMMGLEAGHAICAATLPEAMDAHVCDYEEVLEAEAAGELADLPEGTTFWIHRTTPAEVDGVTSDPTVEGYESGGNCAGWTYPTNHIADGEFGEVGAGGAITYNLDNDTYSDGVSVDHQQPGLPCGGMTRAILCCVEETVMSPG